MRILRFLFQIGGATCLLLIQLTAAEAADRSLVREERTVRVSGRDEIWRLEWAEPPGIRCPGDEPVSCTCTGFSIAETGDLFLVRLRGDKEVDRLHLTPFFLQLADEGTALLRRWEYRPKEDDAIPDEEARRRAFTTRPSVQVMNFYDLNRDGQKTEFLLQVGTLPCGKRLTIAVGLAGPKSKLAALASVEAPSMPLVTHWQIWEKLIERSSVEAHEWQCFDHGGAVEESIRLWTDTKGIHAVRTERNCEGAP